MFPETWYFSAGVVHFEKNNEFKSDLIELQKIRNKINEKLENTDYHAIITYRSWW